MDWISKCQSARIEIYPIVSLKVSTLLSLFSYGSVGMCCRRPSNASLMLCKLLYNIREHLLQKRMFSFFLITTMMGVIIVIIILLLWEKGKKSGQGNPPPLFGQFLKENFLCVP